MFNQRVSLTITVGYNMQQQVYEEEEYYQYNDGKYYYTIYTTSYLLHGLSLRIGVGF